MAKPTFRLATLLRVRENTRDMRRAELALTYREDETLGRQQEELGREQETLRDRTREAAGPGAVDVQQLIAAQQYDRLIAVRQEELRQRRRALAEEIERRCEAAVAADREVKVIERSTCRESHDV
jgi:hypothetical protein